MLPMKNKLTAKQERFVAEYLIDLNATQAAIRAGYSDRVAKEQGYENLTKPHIQGAIQAAQQKHATACDVTVFEVTRMYRDSYELARNSAAPAAMVSAATGLAKLHGLIVDRAKVESTVTVKDLSDDELDRRIAELAAQTGLTRLIGGA